MVSIHGKFSSKRPRLKAGGPLAQYTNPEQNNE